MGVLSEALKNRVKEIIHVEWSVRDGRKVPEPEDLKSGNDAVRLEATIMYADLAESTKLVDGYRWWFAGEIYKSYLECAARIIKASGATIVSWDGDRVMAVYLGDTKEDDAVKAALKINGAVSKIINPRIREVWKDSKYYVNHGVGIDTSEIYAAKIGVRNDNDIVWIGKAANRAAKLCAERLGGKALYITKAVYDKLNSSNKLTDSKNMWEKYQSTKLGIQAYRSSYRIENF